MITRYSKDEFAEQIKIAYSKNIFYFAVKEEIEILNFMIEEHSSNIEKHNNKAYTHYYNEQIDLLEHRKKSLINKYPKYDTQFVDDIVTELYSSEGTRYYDLITDKKTPKHYIYNFINHILTLNYILEKYKINIYAQRRYKGKTKTEKEIFKSIRNSINQVIEIAEIMEDDYLSFYLTDKTLHRINDESEYFLESEATLLANYHNYLCNDLKIREQDKKQRLEIKEFITQLFDNFKQNIKSKDSKFFTKIYL